MGSGVRGGRERDEVDESGADMWSLGTMKAATCLWAFSRWSGWEPNWSLPCLSAQGHGPGAWSPKRQARICAVPQCVVRLRSSVAARCQYEIHQLEQCFTLRMRTRVLFHAQRHAVRQRASQACSESPTLFRFLHGHGPKRQRFEHS